MSQSSSSEMPIAYVAGNTLSAVDTVNRLRDSQLSAGAHAPAASGSSSASHSASSVSVVFSDDSPVVIRGPALDYDMSGVSSLALGWAAPHHSEDPDTMLLNLVNHVLDSDAQRRDPTYFDRESRQLVSLLDSLLQQHGDDVFVPVEGGRQRMRSVLKVHFAHKTVSLKRKFSGASTEVMATSVNIPEHLTSDTMSMLFLKDKFVASGVAYGKKAADNVLGAKIMYAISALAYQLNRPVTEWDKASEPHPNNKIVSQPSGGFAGYDFAVGAADTVQSANASLKRYPSLVKVVIHAGHGTNDLVNSVRSLDIVQEALSVRDRVGGFGRAVQRALKFTSLQNLNYEALETLAMWLPSQQPHESVLSRKMMMKRYPSGYKMGMKPEYCWQLQRKRVVFVNPDPRFMSVYVHLLTGDAIRGRFLAIDTERALRTSGTEVPDVVQIASTHYVIVMQWNVHSEAYKMLLSALFVECLGVAYAIGNDERAFSAIGLKIRCADLKHCCTRTDGLYHAVLKFLGTHLHKDKAITLSDWSVLNLSDVQMRYAVQDVSSLADVMLSDRFTESMMRLDASVREVGAGAPIVFSHGDDDEVFFTDGSSR